MVSLLRKIFPSIRDATKTQSLKVTLSVYCYYTILCVPLRLGVIVAILIYCFFGGPQW